MAKVTARIEPFGDSQRLFLVIDAPLVKNDDLTLPDTFESTRNEDLMVEGNVAMAILPGEVEAIKLACEAWLRKQNDEFDRVADMVLKNSN